MPWFKVCKSSEITTERPYKFCVGGDDILVAKSHDQQYYAFSNICSHADKPLEKGYWDATQARITCPFHKAIFALKEQGAVKAPPAFSPLETYPVLLRLEDSHEFIFVEKEA